MPRQNDRWIISGSRLVAVALFVGACGGGGQYTNLTTDDPVAQIAEGLTLSVNPAMLPQGFGVQLGAIPADTFTGGRGGSQWNTALRALPPNLILKAPLYEIRTSGTPPEQLFLSVITPADADSSVVDLYGWDGRAWSLLPSHQMGGQMVASVPQVPVALGLFEARPLPPLALTALEPGEALTAAAASAVNAVLLGGVTVQADGSLVGQLPGATLDQSLAVYPVVRNYDRASVRADILPGLLIDAAVRANHLQGLVSFVSTGRYDGLVLDYRGVRQDLRPAYSQFVSDLAARLHAERRTLFVVVESPLAQDGDFTTGGYDLRALAASADALLIAMPDDPTSYGNGSAKAMLAWAVGEVDRRRLLLLTSALNAVCDGPPEAGAQPRTNPGGAQCGANGRFVLLDHASSLAPLGSATTAAQEPGTSYPGQPITLTLSGKAQALEYDATAFAARYTYADDAGAAHTVWLTSAGTLRQRLALAEKYRLGGVVVTGLLAPGTPADLATAITQYKVNLAASAPTQAGLVWTVSTGSGVLAQATAQPGQPYVFVAQAPGDYQFAAELRAGSTLPLGSVAVKVADVTPTPVAITYVGGGGGSGPVDSGSTGGFVAPPPVTVGNFELGGQVPGFIAHPTQMKQAGMTWVKTQAIGDVSGFIASAHGAGFKVLVSALGDKGRATDPSYWPEYATWVAGMASQGADAIEVWNEMNIDAEWPKGQISGTTYTQLLRQAYAAIKGANSNTIVISGALAPTGAEGAFPGSVVNDDNYLGQMAAAGAANYMDCIGIHFNTGTTSPNASSGSTLSGYHYSYYFWPMVDVYYNAFGGSRPLCFTELGYLSPEGFGGIQNANFGWAANITVAQQAQWLSESASLAASSGKVRLLIVWNVDFTQWDSFYVHAGYAMLRPDGSCPACAALDAVMP